MGAALLIAGMSVVVVSEPGCVCGRRGTNRGENGVSGSVRVIGVAGILIELSAELEKLA